MPSSNQDNRSYLDLSMANDGPPNQANDQYQPHASPYIPNNTTIPHSTHLSFAPLLRPSAHYPLSTLLEVSEVSESSSRPSYPNDLPLRDHTIGYRDNSFLRAPSIGPARSLPNVLTTHTVHIEEWIGSGPSPRPHGDESVPEFTPLAGPHPRPFDSQNSHPRPLLSRRLGAESAGRFALQVPRPAHIRPQGLDLPIVTVNGEAPPSYTPMDQSFPRGNGQTMSPALSPMMTPNARARLSRFTSFEAMIAHHGQQAALQRHSSLYLPPVTPLTPFHTDDQDESNEQNEKHPTSQRITRHSVISLTSVTEDPPPSIDAFKTIWADYAFRTAVALAGFLSEYLITGFAIELYRLETHINQSASSDSTTSLFWPATLLTLMSGAMLLVSARVADMHGGYLPFLFGLVWLGVWCIIAGFAKDMAFLSAARAMQGIGIAAFTPAINALIGRVYRDSDVKKDNAIGFYAGGAPTGFFAGLFVASALPEDYVAWYFFISGMLAVLAAVAAYFTVPAWAVDKEVKEHDIGFDWWGAFLITTGLILVSYALNVVPQTQKGFADGGVLATLIPGVALLGVSVWVEGWYARYPLVPRGFLTKKGVMPMSLACVCFFACYGIWLYYTSEFFQSDIPESGKTPIDGVQLALWYLPTAAGGIILCLSSGYLVRIMPMQLVFFISALAWVLAPLLVMLCPAAINYWAFIMPSMLCATIGLDLTFVVSLIHFSDIHKGEHEGFAGAYCSILINVSMSFALSIAQIVVAKIKNGMIGSTGETSLFGFRTAFLLAAILAGVGVVLAALFVRMPRRLTEEEEEKAKGKRDSWTTAAPSPVMEEGPAEFKL